MKEANRRRCAAGNRPRVTAIKDEDYMPSILVGEFDEFTNLIVPQAD
jgi:hypothetical protein